MPLPVLKAATTIVFLKTLYSYSIPHKLSNSFTVNSKDKGNSICPGHDGGDDLNDNGLQRSCLNTLSPVGETDFEGLGVI